MFWLGPPTVSRFWPKSQEKNENRPFYPYAKSCRELKLSSSGVIFRDGAANNAQKFIAPPKQLVLDLTLDLHGDFLLRKFHPKFFVGVKKWNVGDRLKRVLAKFEANRSYPRGVNGRSKFCKIRFFFVFGIEKWNDGDRLKRVFPKFEAERSYPRGVNGQLIAYPPVRAIRSPPVRVIRVPVRIIRTLWPGTRN